MATPEMAHMVSSSSYKEYEERHHYLSYLNMFELNASVFPSSESVKTLSEEMKAFFWNMLRHDK